MINLKGEVLSKLPKIIEINGLDDSGRLGNKIILVRLGFGIPYEKYLLIRNIEHFERIIVQQTDLKGHDEKSLVKYVTGLHDDPNFAMSIFSIRPETQLRILVNLHEFLCNDLFLRRKEVIENLQSHNFDEIWDIVKNLSRFENPAIYRESFVKAMGFREISKKLDSLSNLSRIPDTNVDRLLTVQIDGGYPFAFWWQGLITSVKSKLISKGSAVFSGITNGDKYYPAVSSAGIIAYTFSKYSSIQHAFPIHDLDVDLSDISEEEFYEKHSQAFIHPIFQQRILFIGSIGDHIERCLPYLLHRRDRRKSPDVFRIEQNVENFFKGYGWGSSENTTIVYGNLENAEDKASKKLCEERGYPCLHMSELEDDFDTLITELENEIDLFPRARKVEISAKLQKIKTFCKTGLK